MEKLLNSHKMLFSLFLLLQLQFSSLLLLSLAYDPPSKYFMNCGSDQTIQLNDGRSFIGDRNSSDRAVCSTGKSISVINENPSTNIASMYQTARVYKQPSVFQLDISQNGTYVVRLHFFAFPSSLDLEKAIFNVSASGFWLLSNFEARKSSNSPVIKEFFIPIKEVKFRIHFLPSQGSSMAFVNAIEVFLVAENLIPDNVIEVDAASGRSTGNYSRMSSQVLHTIHRINVGGVAVNDRIWRTWIRDDEYMYSPKPQEKQKNENYNDEPKYGYKTGVATEDAAPPFVYMSARALKLNSGSNQSDFFNITWTFAVSKNAKHFVRLHFCDIISLSISGFFFNSYIHGKFKQTITPYDVTDVLEAPFYRNFLVESDKSGYLNVSIGPVERSPDLIAFLNGLEIMELMEKSGVHDLQCKPKRKSRPVIAGSVGGSLIVMGILVALILLALKYWKEKNDQTANVLLYGGSPSNRPAERLAHVDIAYNLNLELKIPFAQIKKATRNFNKKLVLGEGGFGKVFEGNFPGLKVAVKRSQPGHGQGLLEFTTEIIVLSQIRHRHLVSLIGYCDEGSEMILVYEYMEKGTLRDHLYTMSKDSQISSPRSELSWKQRLEICIGAAEGLHYLHTNLKDKIIHHDIKSTNILLDEHYVAKVADFGLSKSGPPDENNFSTALRGSIGYIDPEAVSSLQFTEKSDVYSFGVVLLEVLCARPALVRSLPEEEKSLANWGMSWIKKRQLEKIIDPFLENKIAPDSLRKFSEIAESCLKRHGNDRPAMYNVLYDLNYALQLQLNATRREPHEDSTSNASWELPVPVLQRLPSHNIPLDEDDGPLDDDNDSDSRTPES